MAVGDVIAMLEHAYYSVISPEGCASILWKDAGKKIEAASALKLNSEHLLDLNIIDSIIAEPFGGAHNNPEQIFKSVKQFIFDQWTILKSIPVPLLVEQRYRKFRQMGQYTEN